MTLPENRKLSVESLCADEARGTFCCCCNDPDEHPPIRADYIVAKPGAIGQLTHRLELCHNCANRLGSILLTRTSGK